jgi:hypothetical protein
MASHTLRNNSGTLVINNSTISGNTVNSSCELNCLVGGGGIFGAVTIRNSTISGNYARYGSAIWNYWGGNVSIINSTISGNRPLKSATIHASAGTVSISNSTISGNYGIGVDVVAGPAKGSLQNSIVANNSSANCIGVTSKGYNEQRWLLRVQRTG